MFTEFITQAFTSVTWDYSLHESLQSLQPGREILIDRGVCAPFHDEEEDYTQQAECHG
jgi:hypothetical protein